MNFVCPNCTDESLFKISDANKFAMLKHFGQKRDGGEDYYFGHLVQVQNLVRLVTSDELVIAASVLHDVLEDTDATYYELVEKFGFVIADLVLELTHEGVKDGYGYYFPLLKSKGAVLIKFCDRLSNLSSMGSWSEERQVHYLKKSKFWKDGSDLKEKSL
jgi:GTP diphosphokinase / guanosine-3',5'-bis(diphosphate) 3'-diphosphatase